MRIDDECRDPDLLAAEVRRLRTVIAAGEPTPSPPAPPAITEGSSKGNYKREHFREMPKGPPPALQSKPTLTDAERQAIQKALKWALNLRDTGVTADSLRSILERLT
jgi:hypothetical protein